MGRDMSSRPWMPFYTEDFRGDTLGLSLDEIGLYFIMILLAWRNGTGSIPGDMKELKAVLKCCCADLHGHTFNRIVPKLLHRFFHRRDDGRFYQKRVVKELEKAVKLSAKQSQNADKRWSDYRYFKSLGYAVAMPSHSHKKERLEEAAEKGKSNGISSELEATVKAKGWA
jgi:uncharacterized protein YdaU (DUF1376 family)